MQASDRPLDLREAKLFLDTLVAGDSDQEEFGFQTLDDNKTRKDVRLTKLLNNRFGEVAGHLERLNQRRAGVYVTVNKIRGDRRRASNVTAIRAVFADLDGAPLEPVLSWKLAPHIVVESSPGKYHARSYVAPLFLGVDQTWRIALDDALLFPYSLKYGNVKCRRGFERACPGQPPGNLPFAGAGRPGGHGRRPGRRKTRSRPEYAHLSFRPAALCRTGHRPPQRPLDDLCRAVRGDERSCFLPH